MRRWVEEWLLLLAARLHGALSTERGQTLSEYGLVITLIAVGVTALALIAFRTQLVTIFDSATTCLSGTC